MYKNIVPLNSVTHAELKLSPVLGFSYAKSTHLCSVVLHEFPAASANYPIVFIKKSDSNKFYPVVLLGLQLGENMFVNEDGAWNASAYVPAAFRRYPFGLARDDAGGLIVCFDEGSDCFDTEKGTPLFAPDGQASDGLKRVQQFLMEMYNSEVLAEKFTEKLQELDLLVPGNLDVNTPNGMQRFEGAFLIDENKLTKLSNEQFLSLREHGFLAAIYAQMISLIQIKNLSTNKALPAAQ